MSEPAQRTAIGIVEDDAVLRSCLSQMVDRIEGCAVRAAVGTLSQGLGLLDQQLDVLLVDLALPDGAGLEIVSQARLRNLPVRTLVLTVLADVNSVLGAIVEGADGYLLKESSVDEIRNALKTLMNGGAPISPAIAGHILERLRSQPRAAFDRGVGAKQRRPAGRAQATVINLTNKEIVVLEALAHGKTFKEVAVEQGISPYTVGDHVKSIYRKLAVNTRAAAVYEAVQSGLIRLRP